ncbi:hypothetical protein BASA81_003286 [Batrachochytrium salamandrivorans]|nr:hypothetical protein BASA81_003286 [Batrachochytrium salamandrivorans]
MQAILHELTVNDNEVRVKAEEKLMQGVKLQPNELLLALCQECGNHTQPALQGLAIVLLRRLILQEETLWETQLSSNTKQVLKSSLLALLDSPQMSNESNRKKLCDTIANIAYQDEWNELLPYLFQTAQPQCSKVQKENALDLFSNLAHFVLDKLQSNLESAAYLLKVLHSPNESLSVRLAATRATWDVVLAYGVANAEHHEDGGSDVGLRMFEPLIELSLEVLAVSLNEPRVDETIECFIDLASTGDARRWFAKQRLERTLFVMIQIAKSPASPSQRILAMECVVSLMETRGGAIRKMQPTNVVLHQVVPILVSMMTSLPELRGGALQAWGERYPANFTSSTASFHAEDQDDCEGDMESFGASLEYADRVARALKPKNVLPTLFATCTQLLQDQANWQSQHAALLLVAHIVEFITKKEPELGEICTLACQCATAPGAHMRVRHAAFTLIGRVSLDCCPEVQTRHSRMMVQALLMGLRDQVPRVQAHASVALVNYCFGMDDPSDEAFELGLKPYLRDVLLTLFDGLKNSSKQVVQENIISAIAHVAKCAGQDFHPFYSDALQPLKQALDTLPLTEEKYGLRARLVDCISLIGQSVGKERFFPDAVWLIQLLQRTPLNAEDENVTHIQQAWTRLAEVLGEDLGRYLPVIVPFVLEICSRDNLDQGQDDEDEDEAGGGDEENAAALQLVRTAAVDDRLNALDSLAKFATNCKQAFWPYFQPTLEIFIRDVNTESSELDSVRELAAEGLPDLVNCLLASRNAGLVTQEGFQHIFHQILSTICLGCNSEDSLDVLNRLVQSLRFILDNAQQASQPGMDICPDYVEACGMLLMNLMKESMQRRAVEVATFKCDQLEQEADNEAEVEFLDRLADEHDLQLSISAAMGELIKANRQSFVGRTLSADVGQRVFEMTHPNRLCHDQKIAVYILDDVLEHCSGSELSPALLLNLGGVLARAITVEKSSSPQESQSEVAQLVHGAAYGLGVLAQRFGVVPPGVVECFVRLLTQTPKSLVEQESSYGYCLDNVSSALFKIAKYATKQDELYSVWLDSLPLEYDLQESRINSLALIKMMDEDRNPYFLTEPVLAKVVRVLAKVIGTEHLDDLHVDRALVLVQQIQNHAGVDFFKRHVPPAELDRLRDLTQ